MGELIATFNAIKNLPFIGSLLMFFLGVATRTAYKITGGPKESHPDLDSFVPKPKGGCCKKKKKAAPKPGCCAGGVPTYDPEETIATASPRLFENTEITARATPEFKGFSSFERVLMSNERSRQVDIIFFRAQRGFSFRFKTARRHHSEGERASSHKNPVTRFTGRFMSKKEYSDAQIAERRAKTFFYVTRGPPSKLWYVWALFEQTIGKLLAKVVGFDIFACCCKDANSGDFGAAAAKAKAAAVAAAEAGAAVAAGGAQASVEGAIEKDTEKQRELREVKVQKDKEAETARKAAYSATERWRCGPEPGVTIRDRNGVILGAVRPSKPISLCERLFRGVPGNPRKKIYPVLDLHVMGQPTFQIVIPLVQGRHQG